MVIQVAGKKIMQFNEGQRKTVEQLNFNDEAGSVSDAVILSQQVKDTSLDNSQVREEKAADAQDVQSSSSANTLSALEQRILEVEQNFLRYGKSRKEAILRHTGLAEHTYYFMLGGLLHDPRFYLADPVLVDRLRRLQQARLAERNIY